MDKGTRGGCLQLQMPLSGSLPLSRNLIRAPRATTAPATLLFPGVAGEAASIGAEEETPAMSSVSWVLSKGNKGKSSSREGGVWMGKVVSTFALLAMVAPANIDRLASTDFVPPGSTAYVGIQLPLGHPLRTTPRRLIVGVTVPLLTGVPTCIRRLCLKTTIDSILKPISAVAVFTTVQPSLYCTDR